MTFADGIAGVVGRASGRASGRPAMASPFARVSVHRAADAAVIAAWQTLEATAPCSVYQTRAWLLPWLETLGRKASLAPLFVLAASADGEPAALLCLGLRRRAGVKIAQFLGGRDANLQLPLVRPGRAATAADWRDLLRRAARALGPDAPDLFVLRNQPRAWRGLANPLATLRHQPSPSAAYGTALPDAADAFFAGKLSKDSRKKLRKKEERLAATVGPVTHRVAATEAERAAVIDAFLAHRLARFRAQNIRSDFADPRMRAFLEQASVPGADGIGLELHALFAGPRIVAIYGGGAHGGGWSGMVNAFDADPAVARNSPGDLLLMKVIAAAIARGCGYVDLGIGEARYKATFCDEPIALFDVLVPLSVRGWLVSTTLGAALRAKRAVKENPHLLARAKRLRGLVPFAAPGRD